MTVHCIYDIAIRKYRYYVCMCDCEVDSSSILQPKCPNTQRIHDRASVWPMLLVQAENDRLTFDTKLCWAAGSTSLANQNRHMAIAMAMHARLGMHSEAHQLVADIVQQISLSSISATSRSAIYKEFLHAHQVQSPAGEHHQLQSFAYSGVPTHVQRDKICCDVHRMLRSEHSRQSAMCGLVGLSTVSVVEGGLLVCIHDMFPNRFSKVFRIFTVTRGSPCVGHLIAVCIFCIFRWHPHQCQSQSHSIQTQVKS